MNQNSPWENRLPVLDAAAFPSFYDDGAAAARSVKTGLPRDLKLARRAAKRRLVNAQQAKNAAEALQSLPAEGETFHVVAGGSWPAWSLVPAILKLAGCHIRKLHLATLGFSRSNIEELAALLDAGMVEAASLAYSVYFKSTDSESAAFAVQMLRQRGQTIAALRIHSKIILADLHDGRALTIESSANLRSCKNIEQFCVTNDRELHDWHAGILDSLIFKANEEGNANA